MWNETNVVFKCGDCFIKSVQAINAYQFSFLKPIWLYQHQLPWKFLTCLQCVSKDFRFLQFGFEMMKEVFHSINASNLNIMFKKITKPEQLSQGQYTDMVYVNLFFNNLSACSSFCLFFPIISGRLARSLNQHLVTSNVHAVPHNA